MNDLRQQRINFKCLTALLFFVFFKQSLYAQDLFKGMVLQSDSTSAMPFVYVITKSNGNGTMSDNDGRFTLVAKSNDTLICSFVGYRKLIIPLKEVPRDQNGHLKLFMNQQYVNLNTVVINAFKYKSYERDYMNEIIDKSKIKRLDYATSPITALYMKYSKEGKQINKLAKIFEALLIEEQVQKKLSREILVRLTGDEQIDYAAFRKYCYYVGDYYIINHDGVELYTKVMECYKRWKYERREF
jgi:CarboxypepD_reg-like domain